MNRNIDSVEVKSMSQDDVYFVKKVPSHPRDSLKRLPRKDDDRKTEKRQCQHCVRKKKFLFILTRLIIQQGNGCPKI